MLTLDQIKNIYRENVPGNTHSLNILTEYMQCELLDSIFKNQKSTSLSFMGGTSIRIVYGSGRFSEDLDFDNFGLSFDDFKILLNEVATDMKVKGFHVEYRFVEKNAYHCYIKFPKILQDNNLTRLKDEKILIRIDTIRKEKLVEPIVFTLNKFDIYRPMAVNSPKVLLSQKLIAIKDRKREKGRDFYDVSFLYGITEPDFDFIEKTLGMNKSVFSETVLSRCKELDFNALAKDVEPFLLNSDQIIRVSTFLEFITKKFSE